MLIETLENRQLLSASPIAAQAKAGTVHSLAISAPQAVSVVAKPSVSKTTAATLPSHANTIATSAHAGEVATLAKSAHGAVGTKARH